MGWPMLKTVWAKKDHIKADFVSLLSSIVNGIESPDGSISVTYFSEGINLVVDPANVAGTEEITVVTAIQFSGGKFQQKTRTIKVYPTADETGWTDIVGTTDCT